MHSISLGKRSFLNSLFGIFSRTYVITPPPFLFLSRQNGLENPRTKNCAVGKVLSSFISVIKRISMYFRTVSFSWSNLFVSEFMFKMPIVTLFMLIKFLIFKKWFQRCPIDRFVVSLLNVSHSRMSIRICNFSFKKQQRNKQIKKSKRIKKRKRN